MKTEIFDNHFPDVPRQPDSARDDDINVRTGPYVLVPVATPAVSQLLARVVVVFAATMAFAVLVMITVLFLFSGADDSTKSTTRVDTTQSQYAPRTCYPFGDCAPAAR